MTMHRTFFSALTLTAALTVPVLAQAQTTASSTVTLSADVAQACAIGSPTDASVSFGNLTGPNGRVATGLPTRTTTINNAWCNIPGTLTVEVKHLALLSPPAYNTPAGFSRSLAYDVVVSGWDATISKRAAAALVTGTSVRNEPHSNTLQLSFSNPGALDSGGIESPTAVLEAGSYAGSVVVKLAPN